MMVACARSRAAASGPGRRADSTARAWWHERRHTHQRPLPAVGPGTPCLAVRWAHATTECDDRSTGLPPVLQLRGRRRSARAAAPRGRRSLPLHGVADRARVPIAPHGSGTPVPGPWRGRVDSTPSASWSQYGRCGNVVRTSGPTRSPYRTYDRWPTCLIIYGVVRPSHQFAAVPEVGGAIAVRRL